MENIQKKKGNKGLIILIVILIILLFLATSYICYDKGVFDDFIEKGNTEQEEKLAEEEVKKLHNNLITTSKGFGFYFNHKVSIDEIPSDLMLQYAIDNYLDEKNIKYNPDDYYKYTICGDNSKEYYFCDRYDDNVKPKEINNDITKKMTINKEEIDLYIKNHFNTNRDFVYGEEMYIYTKNNDLRVDYNSNKKEYYLTIPQVGGVSYIVDSQFISFEEKNNELVIFDKVLVCATELGTDECYRYLYSDSFNREDYDNNNILLVHSNGIVYGKDDKIISDGNKYFENYDKNMNSNFNLIFKDFSSELKTFKHKFKKASDGKYYWYSSEIINE